MATFWNSQSPRTKMLISGAVVIAAVMLVFILGLSGGGGNYTLLVNQLNAQSSAQISSSLKSAGIPYQLNSTGDTILVDSARVNDARALLVEKNLVGGGHIGWALFDKTKLGTTDFQQKIMYQRALEDQVALSLEAIDGVQQATVNLALPDNSVFSTEQNATTAGVILQTNGASLIDGSEARSMAQLVASEVPGLDIKSVTITDQTGTPLWSGGSDSSVGGGESSKLAVEGSYDRAQASQLTAMLTPIVGPGKVAVQVKADLNVDKRHIESIKRPILSADQLLAEECRNSLSIEFHRRYYPR